jgi:hypothetical protein
MLRNPINVTRKIIDRLENWEDHIISPKLDGIRGLLVVLSNQMYIVYESRLEHIADIS